MYPVGWGSFVPHAILIPRYENQTFEGGFSLSQFVLPTIEWVEISDAYGSCVTSEPHLPKGFGITVGNSLRRVLLSSLPGVAVTWVQIEGIQHEFSTIPHVKEDTIELLLNVRALRLRSTLDNWPARMFLEVEGKRDICAADIKPLDGLEIVNPELHLATLDSTEARLSMEFNVERGIGYKVATHDELPVGAIPVDAIFTPIRRVNYRTESVHVGQAPDREKLIIEIWTDGSISPCEALNKGAQILIDELGPFASAVVAPAVGAKAQALPISTDKYNIPLEALGLPGKVFRSLMRNHIITLGELLEKSDEELLNLPKFGQKSLDEVKRCLIAGGFIAEQSAEVTGSEQPASSEVENKGLKDG